MTTVTLEKEEKIISFDKIKFEKDFYLTEEQIKEKLDEIDEYYKTHEFVGIPVEQAYLSGIKKLKFEYDL